MFPGLRVYLLNTAAMKGVPKPLQEVDVRRLWARHGVRVADERKFWRDLATFALTEGELSVIVETKLLTSSPADPPLVARDLLDVLDFR
jgi:hypothetical protein